MVWIIKFNGIIIKKNSLRLFKGNTMFAYI